ncbi:putative aquaporin [Clavispora lusitaniae]|uniref:Aquaporin n=1 Tax=Clavispora lusitaniae TaxID=36911 RepID=A0ACD0WSG7_CLALS|nr:putative integral membrane protein [Clavispora lusitaniae]QFZ30512.1 putative aquaporin [Clavispora lusitaniae]QFZ36174.1 putative aquaporin [Clavispora lusitaniae]QFZ41858.1 putative aquaporin [Clavispora lusitaniae]QFZ47534.1 putative aquaporin [Clavispora lusitaniae]
MSRPYPQLIYKLSFSLQIDKAQTVQNPYTGTVGEPSGSKEHIIAFLNEFSGTFVYLWIIFVASQYFRKDAAIQDNGPKLRQWIVISLAFGLGVMAPVCMFSEISPNWGPPATWLFIFAGVFPPVRVVFLALSNIAATIATAGAITFVKAVAGGTSMSRGVFIESLTICAAFMAISFGPVAVGSILGQLYLKLYVYT